MLSNRAARLLQLCVTAELFRQAPRLSFVAFQHLSCSVTLFCAAGSPATSPRFLPCLGEVPRSGFGYPLRGVSYAALRSLFQLPALLGFSLQSFSPHQRSKERFRSFSPLLRFLTKPFRASYRRFSGLLPLVKPRPFTSTPDVYSGSGPSALLVFPASRALPTLSARIRVPFPNSSPLALFVGPSLNIPTDEPQGFQLQGLWLSPFVKGAGPFGVSHRLSSATSSGNASVIDYFFLSAPKSSYDDSGQLLHHPRLPS